MPSRFIFPWAIQFHSKLRKQQNPKEMYKINHFSKFICREGKLNQCQKGCKIIYAYEGVFG